jgi:hypothetical protein
MTETAYSGGMSDVLIRLAAPDEYEAIGELSEAAYSHDYNISEGYRQGLRDVAPRAAEHEASGELSGSQ